MTERISPWHQELSLIAYTIALFGWLEGLILEMIHFTPWPVGPATTAVFLAALAATFISSGLLLSANWLRSHWRWVRWCALPWFLLLSAIGLIASSEAIWAVIELAAAVPLIIFWLAILTQPLSMQKLPFIFGWAGMTLLAGLLVALVSLELASGRLVLSAGMIPADVMALALPPDLPRKQTLRPVRPNRTGAGALGLFFVLGMGAEEISRLASNLSSLAWLPTVIVTTLSFLVLAVLAFALPRKRSLLAHGSAVLLAITLLGFFDPYTRGAIFGWKIALLVAANLLSAWWAVSLVDSLYRAPEELGIAVGVTITAFGAGWWLPLLTGSKPSWLFVAIVMIVALTPLLLSTGSAASPARRGYQGNPEALFVWAKLTPQERRIVSLLLQGKSNQAILGELYVSINTLKTHLKNIYRKTETKNRQELLDLIGRQHERSAEQ